VICTEELKKTTKSVSHGSCMNLQWCADALC